MKTKHADRSRSGFSLIELMMVILIIGLLASIIVPNLGFITGEADMVKNKRNAQNIMLSYTTGSAAGVAWPEGDVATQVAAVLVGQNPTNGPLSSLKFQSTVSSENASNTYQFIGVGVDGELFFDSTGGQDPAGH